jgi:predicted TIM-barrel fold metal-dependent hydrolase
MDEAIKLGTDLGEGRIRHMDEQSIDTQVVSYATPAQLVPDDQALTLTQAANDGPAAAIAASAGRPSGTAPDPRRRF